MFHYSIGKLSCCYFMNQHAKAEQERKQREEDARNKMRPPSTDSEGSDDELDEELRRYCSFYNPFISNSILVPNEVSLKSYHLSLYIYSE